MLSETAAAGFASKNGCEREFRSFASPRSQRATQIRRNPVKNLPIGLPSTPLSAPAKKERAASRSTKLCSSPASFSSPAERAPPTTTWIFVQDAVESNHAHLVLPSSTPIPAASADAAGISTSFCGERQPQQPRSPHSPASSPLCHSRVFVTASMRSLYS